MSHRHTIAALAVCILGVALAPPVAEAQGPAQSAAAGISPNRHRFDPQRPYPTPAGYWTPSEHAAAFKRVCSAINNGITAPAGSNSRYRWEELLDALAGVTDADRGEAVATKVRAFWARHGDKFTCDLGSAPRGSVMRLALSRLGGASSAFLYAMVEDYRIPLNEVGHDGRTLLDFAADQHGAYASPHPDYLRRYQLLRKHGAKHRKELEQEGAQPLPAALQGRYLPGHRRAADAGDIGSMWYLINAWANGYDTAVDLPAARAMIDQLGRHAIRTSDWQTMIMLGHKFRHEDFGVPANFAGFSKDPSAGAAWYRRAAEGGSADGMFWLAGMYLRGEGVPRDLEQGLAWARKAEAGGKDAAALQIGSALWDLGRRDEALLWLRWAAQSGKWPWPFRGGTLESFFKQNGLNPCGRTAKGPSNC